MGLERQFFALTDEQLGTINAHFEEMALRYAQEGEDPPMSAEVVFTWTPWGRCIDAYFDGSKEGVSIESPLDCEML